MIKEEDLIIGNNVFNWTILGPIQHLKITKTTCRWIQVRCVCGKDRLIKVANLLNRHTPKSCGCQRVVEMNKTTGADKNVIINGYKICTKCKINKPIADFAKSNSKYQCQLSCRLCSRKQRLKREYNISPEEYDNLLIAQNNKCLICNKHYSEFKEPLHVDHCHLNGKVRGLLCGNCNRGIGIFSEDIQLLKNAMFYLERA